jgi:hypothetical protein
MAKMRCSPHKPFKTKIPCVIGVEPVGYPDTALVCGAKGCAQPALIWLEPKEKTAYDSGARIFECFTGSAMKVRAKE